MINLIIDIPFGNNMDGERLFLGQWWYPDIIAHGAFGIFQDIILGDNVNARRDRDIVSKGQLERHNGVRLDQGVLGRSHDLNVISPDLRRDQFLIIDGYLSSRDSQVDGNIHARLNTVDG